MIDPRTRDIVQNIYIRKVEKVDGQLYNVEFETVPMAKDPAKQPNQPRDGPSGRCPVQSIGISLFRPPAARCPRLPCFSPGRASAPRV